MTPERYEQIREVFLAVREVPAAARAARLEELCGGDGGLREEVESLLASDEAADTFLQKPALGTDFAMRRPESLAGGDGGRAAGERGATAGRTPERIGQYRILDVLGQGGMGVVYRAEQQSPRRIVALKVIRPGVESREALKRFEHEGQVLAWLRHPGIAQVYEAGMAETEYGPQPFFALELVEGRPLTEYAHAQGLGVRERLGLMVKVCDAVQHAHQKGVIHRDLKPGNILVDAGGQPKILDFGVARATDADMQTVTLHTAVGQLLGTVGYMSPEQVTGQSEELDTRSDVYALGVILYELLTGHVPVDVSEMTLPQAVRAISEGDPAPLGSINRMYRGDIEAIVAKALEKDKRRRYESASDLATDIRRHLAYEPIAARPITTMYQLGKFARRNRVLVASVLGIGVVLLVGTVVSTSLAIWAMGAEELARDRLGLAEQRRQEATEALATAMTETARAKAFGDFLLRMLGHVNPEVAQGRDVSLLRVVLDAAAADIQTELAAYPDVQASIHQVVGTVYRNISLYDRAEVHLQRAEELRATHLGEDAPETLAAARGLAQLRWDQGRLEEAEGMYRRLVERYRETAGEGDRETLAVRYDLAGVVKDAGRAREAEAALRKLLPEMTERLGEDDDVVVDAKNGLAILAMEHGQLEEAERLLREVLAHWSAKTAMRHPKRARALRNLASIVRERGDLEEGERLAREALRLTQEVFGPEHHDTIQSTINMANVLRERGELVEAETLARVAYEQAHRLLGTAHPDTLTATSQLGIILRTAGQLVEAETYLAQAVALSEEQHGPRDPRTLNRRSSLAGLYFEQDKLAEAEREMREVVDGLREALGEDNPSVLSAMNNLGTLLVQRGKLDEAEAMLAEAVRLVDKAAPPGHWLRSVLRASYGQCLGRLERYEEGEAALQRSLAELTETLGATHYHTRGAAEKLVGLYEAWGRPEEAAKYGAATQPAGEDAP